MDEAVVSCPARRNVAIWDIISSSVRRDFGSSEAFALTAVGLERAFNKDGEGSRGNGRTKDAHDVTVAFAEVDRLRLRLQKLVGDSVCCAAVPAGLIETFPREVIVEVFLNPHRDIVSYVLCEYLCIGRSREYCRTAACQPTETLAVTTR